MSERAPHVANRDTQGRRARRLLVIMPSWIGDAVMATPALRRLRGSLRGAYIGGLMRPGLDELMAGSDLFDEVHVGVSQGMMGPKRLAAKVRGRGYDTALLLTNSFSTALAARLAFIPRRVGYDRDGRGLLLTDRVAPERRRDGRYACVSAVEYYLRAAAAVLGDDPGSHDGGQAVRLELGVSAEQAQAAREVLRRAGVPEGGGYSLVNPGANNPAKRWPAERFGHIAAAIARERGWMVLVNGSPTEAEVCRTVVETARAESGVGAGVVSIAEAGMTIGALKGVVRASKLLVTNDTGPRHIAAAFGVPTVTLFGPTDPGWTRLPGSGAGRQDVVANPDLPPGEIADDHPEACRIDRITVEAVMEAIGRAVGA